MPPSATIHLNLQNAFALLGRGLGLTVRRLVFAFTTAESLTTLPQGVPGAFFQVRPVYPDNSLVDAEREMYLDWVTTCAFRDIIESFSLTLEEVRRCCEVIRIIGVGETNTLDDLTTMFSEKNNKFHKLGLPQKLEWLEKEYGITPSTEWQVSLLSLNDVRNCLVHRSGFVTERDANETGVLSAKWSTPAPAYMVDNGELSWIDGPTTLPRPGPIYREASPYD